LRSRLALLEPRFACVPTVDRLRTFVAGTAEARRAAMRAVADAQRRALLDFDAAEAQDLADLGDRLAAGLGAHEQLLAQLCAAWSRYLKGAARECVARCSQICRDAMHDKVAAIVVESQALHALAALELDSPGEALAIARQASLAARSEGLPQPEFLAHLVLARARRHARQSHLSLRIIEGLRSVVPVPWLALSNWEWIMAGGDVDRAEPDLESLGEGSGVRAVRALAGFLRAAASPGGPRNDALQRFSLDVPRFQPVSRDAAMLMAALDPSVVASSADLEAWRNGHSALLPSALDGLRLRGEGGASKESAAAYVIRYADRRATRVLHWGLALVAPPDAFRVPQSHRSQGRVETLISVLALAAEGRMKAADCFAATYGFPFVLEIHRGVFDVLIHRTRIVLGDGARILRDGDYLELVSARSLVIPDPRVSQRTADRVLRLLAERGAANAKDVARRLGISLRAAQGALSELSTQGACEPQKQGRSVAYLVEGTAFSDVTARSRRSQFAGLGELELSSG